MSEPRPTADIDQPTGLKALLVVLCGALALVVAGNSALAIALPDLASDLSADQTELTWIVDAYALTFAALLLPAGILADRVGRRTIIGVGLTVFGIACLVSAYAGDPTTLSIWRAVAGVGAAAVFPVTLSALVDAYPEDRRPFAVATWSAVSAIGAVGGTIVAGSLLEFFGWPSVQLVFGAAALMLVVPVVVLVAQRRNPDLSLDPVGALLSVIGLGGLVFGIIEAPARGWTDGLTLASLTVGVLGIAGFVLHELRSRAPSLDVRLFRSRGLSTGSLIVAAQFFASLALFVLLPQYLQIVRGYGPLATALALLVIPVGVGAGTGLAPALLTRWGGRILGATGLAVMAVGFATIAAVLLAGDGGSGVTLVGLAVGLVAFGFGFGASITPGTILIIDGLPAERRSVASAVNDITREVGGVLGIAVLSGVLVAAYRDRIAEATAGLSPDAASAAQASAGAALGVAQRLGDEGGALAAAATDAFTRGLGEAMAVGAAVLLVTAIGCALFGPRRSITTTSAGAGDVVPVGGTA